MSINIKNLLIELSEVEEDIVNEFCAINKLEVHVELNGKEGGKTLIIKDLGNPIISVFVKDQDSKRVLVIEILDLKGVDQKSFFAKDPSELTRVLLSIQEKLLK